MGCTGGARWDKGRAVTAGDYMFFVHGKWNENYQPGTGLSVLHRIVPSF
jgi:hypothetical protein